MLATLISSGSGAAWTHTEYGRRDRSMRRTTISCSDRSFAEVRSSSPRWSAPEGSALRLVDPARPTVAALDPLRRTRSSGLAPTIAPSGDPQQKQKQLG